MKSQKLRGVGILLVFFLQSFQLFANDSDANFISSMYYASDNCTLTLPQRGLPESGRIDVRVLVKGIKTYRFSDKFHRVDGQEISIPLTMPAVTDGLSVSAEVVVAVSGVHGDTQTFRKKIWIVGRDAFLNKRAVISALGPLTVFDPGGQTISKLERSGLTFRTLTRAASIADVDEGVLIVGSGTDWGTTRGLADVLHRCWQRGVHVLVLSSDSIKIPLVDCCLAESVTYNNGNFFSSLDKRLVRPISEGGVQMKALRSGIFWISGDDGWPWLEMTSAAGTKFIISDFNFIKQWDDGPESSYYFSAILGLFTERK